MSKCLFILTFLLQFFTEGSNAQSNTDTAAINRLINDSWPLRDSQPEKALQMINEALTKSLNIRYKEGIANAYARLGRWYFGSNIDTSVGFAQKALAILENEIQLPEKRADMHLLLAEAYDEQGRTDSSAYYYYLLGNEAESNKDLKPEFMIDIYTKLAIFWVNVLSANYNDPAINNTVRNYVQKAREVSLRMKDTASAISSIYFLEGIYYQSTGKYDSARYFYFKFLEARERIKKLNVLRKISTLSNISGTYLDEKRPEDAMVYINQVKELGKDPSQKNYLSFFMAFVGLLEGKALYQMKDYKGAVTVLNESLEKLKATGGHLRSEVVDAYKDLADSYEALGDYRQALTNRNAFVKLNDSLNKREKLDMLNRQEISSGIAQKDKELVQQQLTLAEVRNKVKNKNLVIGSAIALFVILGLLAIMWRRRNINKTKIDRLNASIAGEEKERTRIARELHDGIGGLITASKINFQLARKKTDIQASDDFNEGFKLLEEAAIELRQAARNLMPEILMQEGLIKALQLFCHRISEKSDTQINFQVLGEKKFNDQHFELTIYRVVQELIHNIVKHSKAKTAIVQLSFQEDAGMQITVEDDGVGINKTTLTSGMGLKNISDRIKETGGKLDIQSGEGKGTSVVIEYDTI